MCNHAWKCNASSCWGRASALFLGVLWPANATIWHVSILTSSCTKHFERAQLSLSCRSRSIRSFVHYGSNDTEHFSSFRFLSLLVVVFSLILLFPSRARICVARRRVSTRMKFRAANSTNRKANADSIRVLNRRDRVSVDIWRDRCTL